MNAQRRPEDTSRRRVQRGTRGDFSVRKQQERQSRLHVRRYVDARVARQDLARHSEYEHPRRIPSEIGGGSRRRRSPADARRHGCRRRCREQDSGRGERGRPLAPGVPKRAQHEASARTQSKVRSHRVTTSRAATAATVGARSARTTSPERSSFARRHEKVSPTGASRPARILLRSTAARPSAERAHPS
jgi:hypothetical protein